MKLPKILILKLQSRKPHDQQFAIDRKKICDSCPLNSKNYNREKGLWYKMWDMLNFKEPFCTVCGCELHLKQGEIMEQCPEGKW